MAATPKVVSQYTIGAICQTADRLEKFYVGWGNKLIEMETGGEVLVHRTNWVDQESQRLDNLEEACKFIDLQRKSGKNVLVHCAQGKSRSSSLIIGYLLWIQHVSTYDEAFQWTRSRRSIVQPNPGFEKQLRTFEQVFLKREN